MKTPVASHSLTYGFLAERSYHIRANERSSQSYFLADVSSRVGIFIANIPNKFHI